MAIKECFAKFMNSVDHVLPGGNKIDFVEKMIFVFLMLNAFQSLTEIKFINMISNNIKNRINYLINYDVLDLLSSFVVFVFAIGLVLVFIEAFISKIITEKEWYINQFEMEYFSLWLSKYYILYLLIYIFINNIDSLDISKIGKIDFLICIKYIIIILITCFIILRIIGLIFIERFDTNRNQMTVKSKIAESILAVLYTNLSNNSELNYFDEKIKALHIINDEVELLKSGVDIEKIEKQFKKK